MIPFLLLRFLYQSIPSKKPKTSPSMVTHTNTVKMRFPKVVVSKDIPKDNPTEKLAIANSKNKSALLPRSNSANSPSDTS